MSRRGRIAIGTLVLVAIVVAFVFRNNSRQGKPFPTEIVSDSLGTATDEFKGGDDTFKGTVLTSQSIDYFTFDSQSFGPQFGATDRWGIAAVTLNAYANRISEIRTLATEFAARRQWLLTNGYQIPPDANWLVYIQSAGVVNQQLRVHVSANVGKTVVDARGTDAVCAGGVEELWQLIEGAQPQLLERSDLPFDQLNTHQESPVTPVAMDILIGEPIDIGGQTVPRQPVGGGAPEPAPPLPW